MAICAGRDVIGGVDELRAVNVLMAFFALSGRRAEIGISQLGAHVRWFMAVDASDCPVRSGKREVGLGMIKFCEIFPGLRAVTNLAAERLAVRSYQRHPLFKLALVGIGVAALAVQILPVIRNLRLR